MTNEEAVKNAVLTIIGKYGRIDVLMNNAGDGFIGAVEEVTNKEINQVMQINVYATLRMIRYTLPIMQKSGSGHIINLSSIAGIVSSLGFGIYNATVNSFHGHA